jgi:Holliday junction resolvase
MQKNILYKRKIYIAATFYVIGLVVSYLIFGFSVKAILALTLMLIVYIFNLVVDFAELKFNEKDELLEKSKDETTKLKRVHENQIQTVVSALRKEREKIEALKNGSMQDVQTSVNEEIEKIRAEAEEKIRQLQEVEKEKLLDIETKYLEQIKELEAKNTQKNGWIPKEEWLKLQKEKEEKGRLYELQVGEQFESEGYVVDYRGIGLGKKDGGIDLIAKKGSEIILIQCKNWRGNIKIKQADIRKFYGDCSKYVEDNFLARDEVKYQYIIPSRGLLDRQAERFFIENHTRIRYVLIEAKIS